MTENTNDTDSYLFLDENEFQKKKTEVFILEEDFFIGGHLMPKGTPFIHNEGTPK
jgi:hypothetical protein